MKSKNVIILIKWLNNITNIIDLPRDFTIFETKRLISIAEDELLNINVDNKIKNFKNKWYIDCDIKSNKVKKLLDKILEKNNPFNDTLLSENEVIDLIRIAENDILTISS